MIRGVIFLRILLIVFLGILFYGCTYLRRDLFVLPNGYKGCVLVVYSVEKGVSEELNSYGDRLFYIPDNGILETQAKIDRDGILMPKFYYKEKDGLQEIKYISSNDWNLVLPDSLSVVSTLEIGEDLKPWNSFIIGDFGNLNICKDRYKFMMTYFKKLYK